MVSPTTPFLLLICNIHVFLYSKIDTGTLCMFDSSRFFGVSNSKWIWYSTVWAILLVGDAIGCNTFLCLQKTTIGSGSAAIAVIKIGFNFAQFICMIKRTFPPQCLPSAPYRRASSRRTHPSSCRWCHWRRHARHFPSTSWWWGVVRSICTLCRLEKYDQLSCRSSLGADWYKKVFY